MPSLPESENVIHSGESLEVDKKLTCSEHHKYDVSNLSECSEDSDEGVSGVDKADGGTGQGPEECVVVEALRQPISVDSATLTPLEGSSRKGGNCEVTIENKEIILSHIEDGQRSEETSNGHKSSELPEKSEVGRKPGMEVEEHDDLDHGWAYVVVIATFTIMIIVGVVDPGFGILFADFLIENNTTSATTGAIFNTENFAWSVSNLLAGPLTETFGWRVVGMAGGLYSCIGMAASAFTPSVPFLFFSFSVMTGFGSGSATLVSFSIISHYFKKRFGRANGFTTAGMCVGGIIGPPMITWLQERYGFRGATLIIAAFTLLITLAATTFRPVRRKDSKVIKVKESTTPRPGPCKLIGQMVCSLGRSCLLLKSPKVIIIAVAGSFVVGIFLNLSMLIPFVMESKGYTQETTAWCISIFNLCNVASRIIISTFSDMAWFNMLVAYIVLSFLLAVSTIVFGFLQNLMWIKVVLGLCGFGIGSCMFMYNIIMIKYMGLELYVPVMGVAGLICGLWMICSGPLIGVIRDWSESYVVSVCVLGSSGFLSTVLFLLMPVAVAHEKQKEEQHRVKDAKVED